MEQGRGTRAARCILHPRWTFDESLELRWVLALLSGVSWFGHSRNQVECSPVALNVHCIVTSTATLLSSSCNWVSPWQELSPILSLVLSPLLPYFIATGTRGCVSFLPRQVTFSIAIFLFSSTSSCTCSSSSSCPSSASSPSSSSASSFPSPHASIPNWVFSMFSSLFNLCCLFYLSHLHQMSLSKYSLYSQTVLKCILSKCNLIFVWPLPLPRQWSPSALVLSLSLSLFSHLHTSTSWQFAYCFNSDIQLTIDQCDCTHCNSIQARIRLLYSCHSLSPFLGVLLLSLEFICISSHFRFFYTQTHIHTSTVRSHIQLGRRLLWFKCQWVNQ